MSKKYDAKSIQIIKGLEAVKKRPGMYIGDTGVKGLHHLLWEIVDNSVDEALAGYANKIIVTLNPDNSISVEDNGRGIPVDIHHETKQPAVVTIFTELHAGGKFGGESSGYKVSGGLHGVGSSVVNALSDYIKVTVYKDKKEYRITFEDGGSKISELQVIGPTGKKGTKVEFKPNSTIFTTINYNAKTIINRFKQIAYLNPGLTIEFNDKKNENKHKFHSENGLKDFVDSLSIKDKAISNTFNFSSKSKDGKVEVSVAFKFTTTPHENIISFVNNIVTPDGGSHETAFKSSLTKAVNKYATENKIQEKGQALDGIDIREGIYAVISAYLVEEILQFEGQTKSKLSSREAYTYIEKVVQDEIEHIFNQNSKQARDIIKAAYKSKAAREAAKRARDVTRELNKNKKKSFAGKLVLAQSKNASERELFIVEGDSAGGSAKQGRDRKTQAILPLRGKVVNTEKATMKQIIANEELSTLIHAIGGGLGDDFSKSKVNYGKIIIMTDADTDGAHIQALLLTFLYRFMTPLVEAGMVYIAMPPLFKITNKKTKEFEYAWSDEELSILKGKYSNSEIQRYKGLGEMNYNQLWETTMDPKTRYLVKVDETDLSQADKIIDILMGDDAKKRRHWIEENVVFTNEDDFFDKIEKTKTEVGVTNE